MAERTAELDASHAALVRSERLSALGEMASTIGHELRNPLAAVINAHFMVRHTLGDAITPDIDRLLVMAERQTTRAATLADNLTAFVRQREPNPVPLDLGVVVEEVLEATPPPSGIEVAVDVPPLVVRADSDQLTQVLANLIVNGFQAMPDGGTLRIGASADERPGRHQHRRLRERGRRRRHGPGLRPLLHHQSQRHRLGTGHRLPHRRGPRWRRVARATVRPAVPSSPCDFPSRPLPSWPGGDGTMTIVSRHRGQP